MFTPEKTDKKANKFEAIQQSRSNKTNIAPRMRLGTKQSAQFQNHSNNPLEQQIEKDEKIEQIEPRRNTLFVHLEKDRSIERKYEVVLDYEKKIDKLVENLKKSDSLTLKHQYNKEQLQLVKETFQQFPKEIINESYHFPVQLKHEEIFKVKEILFKLENAIKLLQDSVQCLYIPPYLKKDPVPPFVFKDGEKLDHQKELMISKHQLRKAYFDLMTIVKSIELIEMNDSIKGFNEKLTVVCETIQRKKEKVLNEKRAELVKQSLKAESKGIETDEKGEVVSGSIDALIRWSVNPNIDNNIKFLETLLITYRQYLSPREFFSKIISLYKESIEETDDKQTKDNNHKRELKIILMLCKWMQSFPHDFMDGGNESLLHFMETFIQKRSNDPLIKKVIIVKDQMIGGFTHKLSVEEKLGIDHFYAHEKENQTNEMKENVNNSIDQQRIYPEEEYTFTTLPTEQFAQQLTLYEYELFKSIEAKELLGNAWTKKDKEIRSPNLCKLVDHFNAVTNWVSMTILNETNIKQRVSIIKKFICIAEELLRLNNYNGLFEFYSGLNAIVISRLKMTWEQVGTFVNKLKSFDKVALPMKSYQAYRAEIKAHQNYPCIPFFGVYLQDLMLIHEGNEDKMENGDVNFYKCSLTTKVIDDMLFYKRFYEYYRNTDMLYYISRIDRDYLNIEEKFLFEKSFLIEPKQVIN